MISLEQDLSVYHRYVRVLPVIKIFIITFKQLDLSLSISMR